MWAKSESLQNAGHQMAGALTPPRRRKPEKNRVLRCQLVLCAAAVLGMLLLQRLRPESAERFKAESRTMLSSPFDCVTWIVLAATAIDFQPQTCDAY